MAAFEFAAIETLIKNKQKEYYAVLGECDSKGDSTAFIEFSLEIIERALMNYRGSIQYQPKTAIDRLQKKRISPICIGIFRRSLKQRLRVTRNLRKCCICAKLKK